MSIPRITFCFLIFFVLLPVFTQSSKAQREDGLTIEWIYSDQRKNIDEVPESFWTNQEKLILYDKYESASARSFKLFDPQAGTYKSLFDMKAALGQLNSLLREKINILPWPEEFDQTGKQAVFMMENDLFLLQMEKGEFCRITHNAEKDSCPRFSPDGQKIAYVRANDLYYYDINKKQEFRLTFDGTDKILNGILSWLYWEEIFGHHNTAFWWTWDSRTLAVLQTDQRTVSSMTFVDFQPQTPRVYIQSYPKAGQVNPVVRLGILNIEQPEIKWIKLDQDSYEYLIRAKWLPEDEWLSVQTLNRAQTRLDLFLVNKNNGEATWVFSEKDPGWITPHDDLVFLKEGEEFLWASERDGYNHLYRYRRNGTLINKITPGNWTLRASGGVAWVSGVICAVDEKAGLVYFTALKKSSMERHLYRAGLDGRNLERISRQDGVHKIAFSPDAHFYLDEYSNNAMPPQLLVYRNDGTLMYTLAESPQAQLEKYHLQYREFFAIDAKDGFPMPAYLIKPADFSPGKKYPVIINIYGGPSAPQVVNQWDDNNYFDNILLKDGYLIFCVDNRSASGISKTLQLTVLNQLWGDVELHDLLDAVHWLKKQSFVDSSRIGIWGWSGGGMHTLLAMTRSAEFKAGIAVAPVSDWLYYDTRYTEFAMKRPQDNPEGYRKTSLVRRAADLHGRLLLVHGTYDDNVHPQNSWAFANELIRNNIQFDMMIYPMRKHTIKDNPARIHLYTKMREFWHDHL